MTDRTTRIALNLLRSDGDALADARRHAPAGNSMVGSVITMTTGTPRQYAEAAVRQALAIIDEEGAAK